MTKRESSENLRKSSLILLSGLSTVASSAQVLAVFTSCATLTLVMKIAWIFELSSVQNITANLSAAGSTSGNPTRKWKVIQSLWPPNEHVSLWRLMWMHTQEKSVPVKEFTVYLSFPRPVRAQCFLELQRWCLFFHTLFSTRHPLSPTSVSERVHVLGTHLGF